MVAAPEFTSARLIVITRELIVIQAAERARYSPLPGR
jgi:hypothetical protein